MSQTRSRLSGGVFRSAPYVDAFTEAVKALLPHAAVRPARSTPATGAVLLALRAGGIVLDDSIRARVLGAAPEDPS